MSSYPYDDICAPRFVNFLSKSPEHDPDRSQFFQKATPFRPATFTSCSSTPVDEGCEVEDLNSSSFEDKTLTPVDEHQEDISNVSLENIIPSSKSNFEVSPFKMPVPVTGTAAAPGTSSASIISTTSLEPSALCKKPFIPKKSTKEPTRPINFMLHTEQRARERAEFENQKKGNMIQKQLKKLVEAEGNKKKKSAEISQMRKNLVFKARPVPTFRRFEPQKSTKPLTEPVTPLVFRKCIKKNAKCMAGISDEAMDAESLPL